jgi:hypothetical protein
MKKTTKNIKEEAPTVNVGGIAGTGDERLAPDQREPGVKKTKYKKKNEKDTAVLMGMIRRKMNIAEQSTFAGKQVFVVPSHIFSEMKMQKRKGKHWSSYIKEDDYMQPIREYANSNPKKPIIIQCENTGAMMYARYPKS